MTRDEVITELCKLSTKVADHLSNDFAADCFCKHHYDPRRFRFEAPIMNFIINAVHEKINGIDEGGI